MEVRTWFQSVEESKSEVLIFTAWSSFPCCHLVFLLLSSLRVNIPVLSLFSQIIMRFFAKWAYSLPHEIPCHICFCAISKSVFLLVLLFDLSLPTSLRCVGRETSLTSSNTKHHSLHLTPNLSRLTVSPDSFSSCTSCYFNRPTLSAQDPMSHPNQSVKGLPHSCPVSLIPNSSHLKSILPFNSHTDPPLCNLPFACTFLVGETVCLYGLGHRKTAL